MSASNPDAGSAAAHLDEVLADYLQRIDHGEIVDRSRFLADHPDLAADLRAFFTSYDECARLAHPHIFGTDR